MRLHTAVKCVFSGWHPKGLLVAHLHEHKAAVNRIRVSDEHSIFATASNDGTVKVWDSQKMEGKTTTTRWVFKTAPSMQITHDGRVKFHK